jgi:hypothetical protein
LVIGHFLERWESFLLHTTQSRFAVHSSAMCPLHLHRKQCGVRDFFAFFMACSWSALAGCCEGSPLLDPDG